MNVRCRGLAGYGERQLPKTVTDRNGSGAVGDMKTLGGSLLIEPDLGDDSGPFVALLRIADVEYVGDQLP